MSSVFFLFCKSYSGDLLRVKNLWDSIQKFNQDEIPFYISVPEKDLSQFQLLIDDGSRKINWVTDEEIVLSNPSVSIDYYRQWDGRLSQQVVKSEFWRLFDMPINYLCLDSESIFIKDFYIKDFLSSDGFPYTVLHQNKELLQLSVNKRKFKVVKNFERESISMKEVFDRVGPNYDFGPTPVIWSSKVWFDLSSKFFEPNGITIWDAISSRPSELRWYGEAALHFLSIPIYPIEPIFKVYHYDWQYFFCRRSGEELESLKENYLGFLRQSNWEYELDFGDHAFRKSWFSRQVRKIKRFLSFLKA